MRHFRLAPVFLIALLLAAGFARAALAQDSWIQLSAHRSLEEARADAAGFAARLDGIAGVTLPGGWYAVVMGPFERDEAREVLRRLRLGGEIPGDSFVVAAEDLGAPFYPAGAALATTPPAVPASPPALDGAAPDAARAAAEERREATREETRDETLAEAQRSERQLDRDERAELQVALQWYGFYEGRIDAAFGPGTRRAMAAWQAANGFEPTGVLTTRQRARLLGDYRREMAAIGFETVRDETAGIEIELPMGMVRFARYDPPFAHYAQAGDSGVEVLLISQAGDERTLLGLFDIMQTLEIVPLTGERERRRNEFVLTGTNERITSFTYARVADGAVKGYTLIWPAGADRRRELVLERMRASFRPIPGAVLPDSIGEGALPQSVDLLGGLKVRRPERSRSGFFVDPRGTAVTTAEAVENCARVTLDETYPAEVVRREERLGLAVLRPLSPLAPLDHARLRAAPPALNAEVAVAGYSFEGRLPAPTLTFGRLSDLRGIGGEAHLERLTLAAADGDAGGPVFDQTGAVVGVLAAEAGPEGRILPAEVSHAVDAEALAGFLRAAGVAVDFATGGAALTPEELTEIAARITVLVSCWND